MPGMISEELTPSAYWLLRSYQAMHDSFLKNKKVTEWLMTRHIEKINEAVSDAATQEIVRARIEKYYTQVSREQIKEDLARIDKWLSNPVPSCRSHGVC